MQVVGPSLMDLFMISLDGSPHTPVDQEQSVPCVEWMELHHSKLGTLIKVALLKD
jgi:hypothetical protein